MMRRTALVACALALLLGSAGAVAAAPVEIQGIVSHVDPGVGVIYFTDGRVVYLDRHDRVLVNDRDVVLESVRPGTRMVVVTESTTTTRTTTQPGAGSRVTVLPAHPPADVSGTVARVDPQTGVIVFTDGRAVKLTSQTVLLQPVDATAIRPGRTLVVRNAQPVAFEGPTVQHPPVGHRWTGVVSRVDDATGRLYLSDGTVVRVTPRTTVRDRDQVVLLSTLRPGDEIVVVAREPVMPSALPRSDLQELEARGQRSQVEMGEVEAGEIIRVRPQAP